MQLVWQFMTVSYLSYLESKFHVLYEAVKE